MAAPENIKWHFIEDAFSDPGPGMAQAWSTYVGRGDDGVFYVSLVGSDDEGDEDEGGDDSSFDVGSAKDLVDWMESQGTIDLATVSEALANAPEMAEVVKAIDAMYEDLED